MKSELIPRIRSADKDANENIILDPLGNRIWLDEMDDLELGKYSGNGDDRISSRT